ncbi:septum formation initiator [Micromonospora sp. AP08]|uniref:septum formation initiator n=1 Tax=Micromonospora sp. AP08 TaxID=2604467 RepID=UPI0011DB9689|nr:septum formation initiator [Micromonospora sp. AP08]TYB38260.1 septum formation initiator [Micromonospora sp. AP08]
MGRRPLLAAAGWLATTVAATLVGLAAIQLVGAGITGTPGGVRDEREVARALASPAPVTTTPGPEPTAGATTTVTTASRPPATGGGRRGFVTGGGTAVAECGRAGVRLVSWSPAQGYRVKDYDRGPDDHVEVRFVGPEGEHELRLRCHGGEPIAAPHD